MIKRFNLCKADPYTKDGKEYPNWQKVGEMVQFDNGNMLVKIPAIGLEANVFEQKEKPKNGGEDMSF